MIKIGDWQISYWKVNGFAFLFHYEGTWNSGTEKRLYVLWWEINFYNEVLAKKLGEITRD